MTKIQEENKGKTRKLWCKT